MSITLYLIPCYYETLPGSSEWLSDFIKTIPSLLDEHSAFRNITKTILNIYDPIGANGSRTLQTWPRTLSSKWSSGGSGDPWKSLCILVNDHQGDLEIHDNPEWAPSIISVMWMNKSHSWYIRLNLLHWKTWRNLFSHPFKEETIDAIKASANSSD
jgi:hypothetical protein